MVINNKPILLLFYTNILLYVFCSCSAHVVFPPIFDNSRIMNEQYGICSHISRLGERHEYATRDQDLTMIDKIGASFVRTEFDWIPIQTKTQGALDYRYLDSMIISVENHDKSVLGILTIDKRKEITNDWLDYVSQTCKRYKNVVYWEILNEADRIYKYVPGFYSNQYIPFIKEGYKAIKTNNRNAKVTFTGISDIYTEKIDSILSHDIGSYFDIMNVHTYTLPNSGPEVFITYFRKLKSIMDHYKINKPVWLSETGGHT